MTRTLRNCPGRSATGFSVGQRHEHPVPQQLAVSNNTHLTGPAQQAQQAQEVFARTTTPQVHMRTREQVSGLLPGYELLEPGVVPTVMWRPDEPVSNDDAARCNAYAAVDLLATTAR